MGLTQTASSQEACMAAGEDRIVEKRVRKKFVNMLEGPKSHDGKGVIWS
jgi:hypothetical protein